MIKLIEPTETSPNIKLQKFKREQFQTSELPLAHHQNKMDQNNFQWGASAEIMEIIRNKRKSPETLKLVERKLELRDPEQ